MKKVVWQTRVDNQILIFDSGTWDSPPLPGEAGYAAFRSAFQHYTDSRSVIVHKMDRRMIQAMESRGGRTWNSIKLGIPESGVYDIGQTDSKFKLLDFQVRFYANSNQMKKLMMQIFCRCLESTGYAEIGGITNPAS